MKVEIDEQSGFCFGVVRAIDRAQKALEERKVVYCLGDIVHNRMEVHRLMDLGLVTVELDRLTEDMRGRTVLIRAHGEPPSTYALAERCGIAVIDATCPVVAKLQAIVAQAYNDMKAVGGQVVILGKRGHAEVVGLLGQIGNDALVVETIGDLDQIDFKKPIYFLSQTTQSLDLFHEMQQQIMQRSDDPHGVKIHDTICRNVSNREPHLREFAARFDAVVFVAGRKSSNGKILFEQCRSANPRSYFVENESELNDAWFRDCHSVGICGATSTPKWLMERVAHEIETNHKE